MTLDKIYNGMRRYNFDSDRQTDIDTRVFFVLHCFRGLPLDGLMNELNNYEGVYRTAPIIPVLIITLFWVY